MGENDARERTEEEKEDGNRDESGSGRGGWGTPAWDRWDHRLEMVSKEGRRRRGTRGEREGERLTVEEKRAMWRQRIEEATTLFHF